MNLYESNTWKVVFGSWCQEFVGYCIISSNKESLSELTTDDWLELGLLEKELERVCKKVFNSSMYNFCCLMNNAYRDNVTPNVHFHFVPRYKEKLNIFGKDYVDKHFGYNFWKWSLDEVERQNDIFTKEERIKIFKMMKKEFNVNKF